MTCRTQNSSLYLQGLGHCDISGASIGSTDILILMFYFNVLHWCLYPYLPENQLVNAKGCI